MTESRTRFLSLRGALTVAAAVAASGCAVQNVPIRDTSSPNFAVRATFRGSSGEPAQRRGPGVEIGIEGFRAKGTQQLAAGESVVLEGVAFVGPQALQHKAKLQQVYVAYNHLIPLGRHLEIEPYVGLTEAQAKVTTTTASGASVTSVDLHRVGVTGGVTPRWRFNDQLALELRVNFINASPRISGHNFEGALVLRPAQNMALRVGWSDRKHTLAEAWGPLDLSDVEVRSRGPLATLQFDF